MRWEDYQIRTCKDGDELRTRVTMTMRVPHPSRVLRERVGILIFDFDYGSVTYRATAASAAMSAWPEPGPAPRPASQ